MCFLDNLWPFQPDVIEAYSTMVAAFFAIVAAWFALKAYKAESRIERQLRQNLEQEQASKISGWVGQPDSHSGHSMVIVRNASEVPVHMVWVELYGPNLQHLTRVKLIRVLPPSPDGVLLPIPQMAVAHVKDNLGMRFDELIVTLQFTDSQNRGWERNETGKLVPK